MNTAGFRSRPLTSHQSQGFFHKKNKETKETLNMNPSKTFSNNIRIANFLTSMKANGFKMSPRSSQRLKSSGNFLFSTDLGMSDKISTRQIHLNRNKDFANEPGMGISRLTSANKSSAHKMGEKTPSEKQQYVSHNFVRKSSFASKETARTTKVNSGELNNDSFLTPRKTEGKEVVDMMANYSPYQQETKKNSVGQHQEESSSGEEISNIEQNEEGHKGMTESFVDFVELIKITKPEAESVAKPEAKQEKLLADITNEENILVKDLINTPSKAFISPGNSELLIIQNNGKNMYSKLPAELNARPQTRGEPRTGGKSMQQRTVSSGQVSRSRMRIMQYQQNFMIEGINQNDFEEDPVPVANGRLNSKFLNPTGQSALKISNYQLDFKLGEPHRFEPLHVERFHKINNVQNLLEEKRQLVGLKGEKISGSNTKNKEANKAWFNPFENLLHISSRPLSSYNTNGNGGQTLSQQDKNFLIRPNTQKGRRISVKN